MKNGKKAQIKESPLFWPVTLKGDCMLVLDETLLPARLHYIKVKNTKQAVRVIQEMRTRAFGQFLVVLNTFLLVLKENKSISEKRLIEKLTDTAKQLNASRPTFPFSEVTGMVLYWASQASPKEVRLKPYVRKCIESFLKGIRVKRMERVKEITALIKNKNSILTHCNVSGELAMAAYLCKRQGKDVHFFATETRPYFQGSKLTCWELKKMGSKVTLVADNAIGTLLADGLIDLVIVGSDRSCANGDIANKIGTYQIAVCAHEFHVPFYALTQPSNKIKRGRDIPIELRNPDELLTYKNKRLAPRHVKGFYPGFDITPNQLIKKSIAIHAS